MSEAIPDFAPENDLERAMVAAAQDTSQFAAFLVALRAGDLYVPGKDELEEPREQPLGEEEDVVLPVVEWQGQPSVPVFSSLTRLRTAVPDAPSYMAFHFKDLAERWGDHWMILNPGNAVGLPLSPAMIRGETDTLSIPAGTDIVIGEPAAVDARVAATLRARVDTDERIVAAHLAEVILSEAAERPQLVIGLEVADIATGDDVVAAMVEDLGRAGTGATAGVVLVVRSQPNPVAAWMLQRDRPYFVRKTEAAPGEPEDAAEAGPE